MSDYQYYEFCRLGTPLSAETRKEMHSLSSRAQVTTHGASYVYNYGDFRGNPKKLVLKHFDVFFYISNSGTVRLIFKYDSKDVDYQELQKNCIKHVISCEQHEQTSLLEVHISNEEGFGWTEGEGILADLLPLYDEIKNKNYQLLRLVSAINNKFTGAPQGAVNKTVSKANLLSPAQEAFLKNVGIEYKEI
jgi:hypothetical protein